ncbi:MAG TPA: ABC transporter ATP-binding protein [Gemmatimonadales bacterium]|nr:ABC transporter ATP-binding protein [Gemmatimonadales bacterium]
MTAPAAVVTRDLTRRFGDLVAVRGLTLEIRQGEVFGLLGPNGSGKTTTIRMLCGLLQPTGGTAQVAGIDVAREPDRVKARIGYMSQRFGLYEDLTVAENLDFYGGIYGLRDAVRRERIGGVVGFLGLSGRLGQLVGTLSGGWKQRVALGCALLHAPPVLFLDEPTAGVDPAARRGFWSTIKTLAAQGTTVIVTTHYMDEAERCERLGLMSQGRLIALGTPAQVAATVGGATLEDAFIILQERDEALPERSRP